MITLYKENFTVSAEEHQVELLIKAGWSREKSGSVKSKEDPKTVKPVPKKEA